MVLGTNDSIDKWRQLDEKVRSQDVGHVIGSLLRAYWLLIQHCAIRNAQMHSSTSRLVPMHTHLQAEVSPFVVSI